MKELNMNILMRDSSGQLIGVPILVANLCKRMQFENKMTINFENSEESKNAYNNMAISDENFVEINQDNSIPQILLLNLDVPQDNNEVFKTVEGDKLYYDNKVREPREYLNLNNIRIVEHLGKSESTKSNFIKNIPKEINVIVTNDVTSLVCRLCAQQSENMVYIFGLSKEERDVAMKINSCLPIKVQQTDTFPKNICSLCLEKVELFFNFCKIVSETEANFIKNKQRILQLSFATEYKIEDISANNQIVYDCPENSINSIPKEINSDNKSNFKSEAISRDIIQENLCKEAGSNVNERIKCRICDIKFFSIRKCYLHAASHFSSSYYPCSFCETILQTLETWRDHYAEHSNGKIYERRAATFKCHICNKKFISEGRLKFHIKFHEPGIKPCYCEKCDKFVSSESVLYQHSITVHLQFREFCCDICGNQFRSQAQLVTHQRKHKKERPYECTICNKRFYSNDSLRRHKKLHLPDKPLQCDQCGKRFDRTNSLTKHLLTHKVEARQSTICQVCNTCNQVFLDVSQFESHLEACKSINSELPQIEKKILDAIYRCEFCQQYYTSIGYAKIHEKSHTGSLPYVCTICDVTFATYNQVTAHKSAHRKSGQDFHSKEVDVVTKFFFCQNCEKKFLHFTNMNLHRKSCLKNKHWTCRCCAANFQSKQELTRHKKRKESGENWPCDICDMTFGNMCELEIHKDIHTETFTKRKVFICSYCGKNFQQKAHLTIHIRSHTGEKPFTCDLCNKAYSIKADRNNHRRTHTGECPYKCTICSKAFTSPARLREHMLYHSDTRPYKCNYCEQAFKKANARKVHMLIHTGERPFQCNICGNYFRRSGDMNKHKKSQHSLVNKKDNMNPLFSQES